MLYTTKYAPKKLADLVGNNEKIEQVRQWVLQWLSGKKRKPLLLWGPPGVGKTSIVYALKHEYDLDILEVNASELRNKKRIEHVLGGSALASTLFGNIRLVLIDDADIFAGRKDSGGSTAVKNFLKDAPCPIIVTATDVWDKGLSAIRNECEKIEMKKINKLSMKKFIEHVAKAEGLNMSEERLGVIIENASGDMRAALNDLQAFSSSARMHEKDIFQIIRTLLKSRTYADAKEALDGNIDYDSLKLWVDENIPNEYTSPQDIALAYDSLSKADIFDGRIRKTHWKLLKYSIDLSTAGVAIAKNGVYHHFTKYAFPSYLRSMASTMARRAMLKSIGLKIGTRLHTNRREAVGYIPLIKDLGKECHNEVMDFYHLDEEELAFIMETSVSKIKKTGD